MAVIDPNAMYRAGFSSVSKGRNPAADQHNANWQKVEGVLGFLGKFAINEMKEGFTLMKEYKKQTDGVLAPQLAKGSGYTQGQIDDVKKLKTLYDKAAKCATFGLSGKKRTGCREDMQTYMAGMTRFGNDMGVLDNTKNSVSASVQATAGRRKTGQEGDPARSNPGNLTEESNNRIALATGLLPKNIRYNFNTNQTDILTGGQWIKDPNSDEMMYAQKKFPTVKPADGPEEENFQEMGFVPLSSLSLGGDDNSRVKKYMIKTGGDLVKYSSDDEFHAQWDTHKESMKLELQEFMNDPKTDENAFKAFYFGGFEYNHDEQRMTESAPAYQRLLLEDVERGVARVKDGVTVWDKGYEPGSDSWIARRELLKRESFAAGGKFRKEVQPAIFNILEKRYDEARTEWENKRPLTTKDKGGKSGVRREETYMRNSRIQSEAIQRAVKTMDLNDLQNINLQGKYRVEVNPEDKEFWVRRISDGTYMDKLDKNNLAATQNTLYDYGANEYHRVPYQGSEKSTDKGGKKMPKIINVAGKTMAMANVSKDTYTFIGDKPYTKKQFFKAIQGKRLSQEEIEQGGRMATQLQNKR